MHKNKKVITANKALLAEKWLDIAKELSDPNFIRFEAAVAGAIPIIDVLQNGLSANQFSSVYGIMNGTCNFILSRMEAIEAMWIAKFKLKKIALKCFLHTLLNSIKTLLD